MYDVWGGEKVPPRRVGILDAVWCTRHFLCPLYVPPLDQDLNRMTSGHEIPSFLPAAVAATAEELLKPPAELKRLFKHQIEFLNWAIHMLLTGQFGFCIGHDMGLGKTLQLIWLLEIVRRKHLDLPLDDLLHPDDVAQLPRLADLTAAHVLPASETFRALIVVPLALLDTWEKEIVGVMDRGLLYRAYGNGTVAKTVSLIPSDVPYILTTYDVVKGCWARLMSKAQREAYHKWRQASWMVETRGDPAHRAAFDASRGHSGTAHYMEHLKRQEKMLWRNVCALDLPPLYALRFTFIVPDETHRIRNTTKTQAKFDELIHSADVYGRPHTTKAAPLVVDDALVARVKAAVPAIAPAKLRVATRPFCGDQYIAYEPSTQDVVSKRPAVLFTTSGKTPFQDGEALCLLWSRVRIGSTGTVQNNSVTDLMSLALFLNVAPYCHYEWWAEMIKPNVTADVPFRQTVAAVFHDVVHRRDESVLGLPKMTERRRHLDLPLVEELVQASLARDASEIAKEVQTLQFRMRDMERGTVQHREAGAEIKKKMGHILRLIYLMREACNSPDVLVRQFKKRIKLLEARLGKSGAGRGKKRAHGEGGEIGPDGQPLEFDDDEADFDDTVNRDWADEDALAYCRDQLPKWEDVFERQMGGRASMKTRAVVEQIRVALYGRRPAKGVVVFTGSAMFQYVLHDALADLLPEYTGGADIVNGTVSQSNRRRFIRTFNEDPERRVIFITTGVGAVGLNLQHAANHVILPEDNWNPFVDEQAKRRVYRIGQTREVEVTTMTCKNTIDHFKLSLALLKCRGS